MTATNWQGNVTPSPGDDLVFPVTAHPTINNNFSSGTSFNSISIKNGGPTFTGNAIVLNSGINFQGLQCTMSFASITLAQSQTFIIPSGMFVEDFHITSPINLQGFTLTLDSEVSDTVFGFIDGAISGTGNITKAGRFDGEWDLTGNNTFTGLTTINSGFLGAFSPNALGSHQGGTIVNSGGVLKIGPYLFNPVTAVNILEPLTINGNGNGDNNNGPFGAIDINTASMGQNAAITFSGPIILASDSLIIITTTGSGGGVTFANTINLSGFNLYVDAGRTVGTGGGIFTGTVNGPGGVFEGDPLLGPTTPILSGTATINSSLTINKGTLTPGLPTSSGTTPAVLNTGNLTFSSGSSFQETINGATAGTSYSQIVVNGAINLASANLNTNLGFTPVAGTSFVMMECTGSVTGTFNGLADGATLTINSLPFLIHYVNSPTTAGNVGPNTFMGRVVLASTPLNTVAGVSASQNPAQSGQGVTITASVVGIINAAATQGGVGPFGGANLPAVGSVQFMDGGSPLGSPVTLTSGLGSIAPPLTPGVHSITAVFTPGNGSFSPTTSPAYVLTVNSTGWHDVVTGDFLGNGKQDIAGMTASGQWWLAQSTGSGFTNQLWGNWNPNVTWVDVQVGDFDGDGKMDIAGRFLQTGQWWVAVSNGSSFTNQLWTTWNPNVTWVDVKVGDFNGDGKADLVGRFLQTGQWFVAQSTSSSFNNSLWTTWNPNVTWVDVHVGNFAGNKTSDLTGRYLQGGSWWTAVSNGSSFSTGLWAQWNPNVTWVDVKVGDFDNDGKTDLTARWLEGGSWWTALSTGSSFNTTMWAQWNPNVTWVDVQVGDFNGDGKADIVARFSQAGSWWAGISTGSSFPTANWDTWSPLANWVDVSAAEVDGDKFTDLVGRFGATGQWWAAISNGSNGFANQLWTTWAP
jgi:autotransporter-associated beta strand protein